LLNCMATPKEMSTMLNLGASAITGAITGAIGTFMVGPARERHRLWSLSNGVQLSNFAPTGTLHYRIQVHNTGNETINDAIGYLTLDNDPSDILPGAHAYERPGYMSSVRDGRLCWALGGNPHKIDIFPDEKQLLNFAKCEVINGGCQVVIASELGLGESKDKPARVCLKPKNYSGTLKIVAKNILARTFKVEIVVSERAFGQVNDPSPENFIEKWPFVIANSRVRPSQACPR
jgi:hypothetical protein